MQKSGTRESSALEILGKGERLCSINAQKTILELTDIHSATKLQLLNIVYGKSRGPGYHLRRQAHVFHPFGGDLEPLCKPFRLRRLHDTSNLAISATSNKCWNTFS